jgi:hypothetical protein
MQENEIKFNPKLESLHLCRAITTKGDFITSPLGIHNIRQSLENLNSRLPENLQVFLF